MSEADPNNRRIQGQGLGDWAEAAKGTEHEKLLAEIDPGKETSIKKLEELGLPRLKIVKTTPADFLSDPDSYIEQLNTGPLVYITMPSPDGGGLRLRELCPSPTEAVAFVQRALNAGESTYEEVILTDYYRGAATGVLVVSPKEDNAIYVEGTYGPSFKELYGEIPDFMMWRDLQTELFRYEGADERTREMLQRTLDWLSHDYMGTSVRDRRYQAGYYEFLWAYKDEKKDDVEGLLHPLEIVFVDYQESGAFQVSEPLDL
ncbi:hypothetical protein FWG95_03870 [Candidatus Saccharibacteria bacterium]|nr:hypothetical protein [Candidatus Saccharibacteria bacterium]